MYSKSQTTHYAEREDRIKSERESLEAKDREYLLRIARFNVVSMEVRRRSGLLEHRRRRRGRRRKSQRNPLTPGLGLALGRTGSSIAKGYGQAQ